jgi:hypothetical protein
MKRAIFLFLLIFSGIAATGQTEKLIVPSDLKQQTIITEPVTLRKGYIRAGMALSYFALDRYFDKYAKKQYYPLSSWHTDFRYQLNLRYGVTDRLEVDCTIPLEDKRTRTLYQLNWPGTNTDASLSGDLKGKGLSDCEITLKYQLIPEIEDKTSLTIWQWLTFPTGQKNFTNIKSFTDFNLPVGNGAFSTGTWLTARRIKYPYSYSVYAFYAINFEGSKLMSQDDTQETKFKDGNYLRLGANFDIHLNEWIALANDLNYRYNQKGVIKYPVPEVKDPAWMFSYQPGLYFQIRRFRIAQNVDVPLLGKNNGADPLYVMMVFYTF